MTSIFKRTPIRCQCGAIIEPDESYCDVLYVTCPRCLSKINLELISIGLGTPTLAKSLHPVREVKKAIHGNLIY